MIYPKGFAFSFDSICYEKLDNSNFSWWVCLTSSFIVENKEALTDEEKYILYPESRKPLYNKEGRLNRFGFKWTDLQVKKYYKL